MRIEACLVVFILCIAWYADSACVTNQVLLERDPIMYPTLDMAKFYGGEPCFVGKMCSWFFQTDTLPSNVDLTISVNFNPPLFYFLSSNSFKLAGDKNLYIEIPSPKESQIGQYTLDLLITATNLSISGCNAFEIRKPIDYTITPYSPTDNTTILQLLENYRTSIENLVYPPDTLCFTPFKWNVSNDYGLYDPVKAFTITTRLNLTSLECLTDVATRFYNDVVVTPVYQQVNLGNLIEQFHTDGILWYNSLHDPEYELLPIIDTWIQNVPAYQTGSVGSNGNALLLLSQYVNALIRRMAYSGELDKRLPRAVTLMMNSMLNFKTFATDVEYSNGALELSTAMRALVLWGSLTSDPRVDYMLKDASDYMKLWIQPDFQVVENLNYIGNTPDVCNALATGYAAYWWYTGDQEVYNLSWNLINASIVFASTSSGKHMLNYINRNYESLMWLLDPSLTQVKSKIPFVFPDLVVPSNTTVLLPNQNITEDFTLEGDVTFLGNNSVTVNYGSVVEIKGCANFAGTLVVVIKEGQVVTDEQLMFLYSCRTGEFDSVEVRGDVDPCLEYKPVYTPTTMSIVVSQNPNACQPTGVTGPTAETFPDWAIAIIVIGGLGVCGAIIGIVLHFKKIEKKKENQKLKQRMTTL